MNEPIAIVGNKWDHASLAVFTPSSLVHYAMGDKITPEWKLQELSAERFGSSENLNFFHIQEPYRHRLRMELGMEILSAIPPDHIVFYTDAFDLMFNNSSTSVLFLFLEIERLTPPDSFGRKPAILFNGEKNCWPDTSVASLYPTEDLSTEHPYLNSGVMVGRCGAILDVLKRRTTSPDLAEREQWEKVSEDDQRFWTHAYLSSRTDKTLPRISVDHFCRLACCLYAQENDAFSANNGVLFMKKTGVRPCLLHFNGPSKAAMKGVAEQLGYQGILT